MARIGISKILDPQMAEVLEIQRAAAGDLSVADRHDLEAIRRAYRDERAPWNQGGPVMAESRDLTWSGPHGEVPLRLHRPIESAEPLAALVFLHGGGWVVGDLDTHDRIMRVLAAESGCAVLGVDYRLSPEAKFPVALEECQAVIAHLADHGRDWGLDARRLAIGGDSAGANLSLACALHFRQSNPGLIKAALLYYGAYGLKDSASRRKFGGGEDGLSNKDLAFYKASLTRSPADLDDPRIDLVQNEMTGLPPLFIAAAALDPLLDDSRLLSDLAAEAGVEQTFLCYEGVLHAFLHYGKVLTKAREALSAGALWLHGKLAE